MKYTFTDFSIDALMKNVLHDHQVLLKPGVVLKAGKSIGVLVRGDKDKVRQILDNLIENAIKFTEKGSILVDTRQVDANVQISVTDTGIGISKDQQRKLFGKFIQVVSEKSGKPKGSGLGLYIARSMALKMGGDIWITSSEVGKGSTFTFSLPVGKRKNY